MSYCTVPLFKERYDSRWLAQLSADDDTDTEVTSRIQAALDDATARINAAALVGGIYTEAQLLTLVASTDTFLVMLCAHLAACGMARRRGEGLVDEIRQDCVDAKEDLAGIRDGTLVLNIDAAITLPQIVELTADEKSNLDLLENDDFFDGVRATRNIRGTTD